MPTMQSAFGIDVVEGKKFKIEHPLYDGVKEYTVLGVRENNFGLIISYEDGDVHESLVSFLD